MHQAALQSGTEVADCVVPATLYCKYIPLPDKEFQISYFEEQELRTDCNHSQRDGTMV